MFPSFSAHYWYLWSLHVNWPVSQWCLLLIGREKQFLLIFQTLIQRWLSSRVSYIWTGERESYDLDKGGEGVSLALLTATSSWVLIPSSMGWTTVWWMYPDFSFIRERCVSYHLPEDAKHQNSWFARLDTTLPMMTINVNTAHTTSTVCNSVSLTLYLSRWFYSRCIYYSSFDYVSLLLIGARSRLVFHWIQSSSSLFVIQMLFLNFEVDPDSFYYISLAGLVTGVVAIFLVN